MRDDVNSAVDTAKQPPSGSGTIQDGEQPGDELLRAEAPRAPYPPYRPSPYLILFLIMPIVAAIVAFLISGIGGPPSDSGEPQVVSYTPFTLLNSRAPEFSLAMLDGESVSLGSYQGRWVLINFWATWCGPCVAEMPILQDLAEGKVAGSEKLGDLAVLAINRDESAEVVRAFLDRYSLSLPVALDPGGAVSNRFAILNMPTTYILDPSGVVRYRQLGPLTDRLLDQIFAKLGEG